MKMFEDKTRLKDLEKLNHFCHTSILENFHSMMTMACPKYCHFFYYETKERLQLSLIHHKNLNREQAAAKAIDMRSHIVFPKGNKQWVTKKIYTKSSNQYILDLMALDAAELFNESPT